jgi:hypothetical protein
MAEAHARLHMLLYSYVGTLDNGHSNSNFTRQVCVDYTLTVGIPVSHYTG